MFVLLGARGTGRDGFAPPMSLSECFVGRVPLKPWNPGAGKLHPFRMLACSAHPRAAHQDLPLLPLTANTESSKSKVPTQAAPPKPEPGVKQEQLPAVSVQPILLHPIQSDPFVLELQLPLDLEQNTGYVGIDLLHTSWSAPLGPFPVSFPACAKSTLDLSAPGC